MKVVVDTNMVIAALIKDSKAREILASGEFEFFAPEFVLEEIEKYKALIRKKSRLSEDELELLINLVFEGIRIVPSSDYETFKEVAKEIIKEDLKDAPYVACYLALKCDCIWTNDKDYEGKKEVRIFSTEQLLSLMEDENDSYKKDDFEKEE